MRLDVVTIFPDYLRVLDLSLIGKAATTGLIDLRIHDLRDWAHDRHRTVDDTPLGGGAGMVMKADVWGQALDAVLGETAQSGQRQVLVVPTPAGEVFTQRTAEDLAQADQIVFACGRYEGIDARVAEHYRSTGLEVRELSIGDYVLNGGEVATLVMVEAISRLQPGVLGNPESVVEESHSSAGLLEYPVYTRPVQWRGQDLAVSEPVLLSGDHARIARTRRNQAIVRTAARRPDLIRALEPSSLDAADRAVLASHGWAVPANSPHPVPVQLRPATAADLGALAALAARTFPDACPSQLTPEQISNHIATKLTPEHFAAWLAEPRARLTVAVLPERFAATAGEEPLPAGALVGYSLLLLEQPGPDGLLPLGLDPRPTCLKVTEVALLAELSKVYVEPSLRGSGISSALLEQAITDAVAAGVSQLWLGTHTGNKRAQKAYKRAGFKRSGARSYHVGGQECRDVVMSCDLGTQSAVR
ncbi:tRNA (guanosine(37)-N1)-methyltransferase TrmD [Actinomyces bovis]|uniref:tRNA (guanosine(37)-N1)-methyltransferase TrmD n=1 Tax=Actinomyces bovis TaxID=1658 RepID=UPI000DCF70F6|nr:tRNA (guanosine(37)-N1)-methyltransferase TrmD [Actinomyces bovis]